jgi:SpoVK/Ycf46/Vps4 family AAA+-type ATPase
MPETSVIDALQGALQAAPEDDAIRRHLADLLVGEGRAEEALGLYQDALTRHPDDANLVRGAALAARLCGQADEAQAYERVLGEHDGVTTAVLVGQSPPDTSVAVPEHRDEDEDGGVPSMMLADVGGLAEVKARLNMAFLAPAKDPQLSAYYGKSLNGGLLLYGPPGCGKTYIARALAGELDAHFHTLGLNDVLDAYVGESERRLHEAFAAARRQRPALLFLDEIDALGRKRSMIQGPARTVVNQLLTELDGVEADNEGIYTLAATNCPWDVDAALRRPGRFDRTVFVAPPDGTTRAEILSLHLRGRPVANMDVAPLAASLNGFSGADLAYVCESAVELAMQEALRTGERRPISKEHLEQAARGIKPSTRAWFDTAQNVARFASEGGEYDDLLAYMRDHGLA